MCVTLLAKLLANLGKAKQSKSKSKATKSKAKTKAKQSKATTTTNIMPTYYKPTCLGRTCTSLLARLDVYAGKQT